MALRASVQSDANNHHRHQQHGHASQVKRCLKGERSHNQQSTPQHGHITSYRAPIHPRYALLHTTGTVSQLKYTTGQMSQLSGSMSAFMILLIGRPEQALCGYLYKYPTRERPILRNSYFTSGFWRRIDAISVELTRPESCGTPKCYHASLDWW